MLILMFVLSDSWPNESGATGKSNYRDQRKRPHKKYYHAFA